MLHGQQNRKWKQSLHWIPCISSKPATTKSGKFSRNPVGSKTFRGVPGQDLLIRPHLHANVTEQGNARQPATQRAAIAILEI